MEGHMEGHITFCALHAIFLATRSAVGAWQGQRLVERVNGLN
jgi:hypothetical protein